MTDATRETPEADPEEAGSNPEDPTDAAATTPGFHRAYPLQAAKLAVVLGTAGVVVATVAGVLPGGGLESLLGAVVVGIGLVAVVAAETVVAAARVVRSGRGLRAQVGARRGYTAARAVEAGGATLAVGAFVGVLAWLPDGEMAGPGAIGLLFVLVGLALVVAGGTLLRTLAAYVSHRRGTGA